LTASGVTLTGSVNLATLGLTTLHMDAGSNTITISGSHNPEFILDDEGVIYVPDPTRSGIPISVNRDTFTYGRSGNQKLTYLGIHGVLNSDAGYVIQRGGYITSITSHHKSGIMDLHVVESGTYTSTLAEFNGLAAGDNIFAPLSIEVPGNELLQLYLANTTNVLDPVVVVEVAWRLE